MAKIVQLAKCANSFEAQLIKTRLESEGIPSVVMDENIGTIYGGCVSALNPRVLVNEDDLETAKSILADINEDEPEG